jgi:ATP-dependent exoDNAse (exonuclease V) beta subunit
LTGFIGENYTSGVADLYFEDIALGGLVVVDYKTNATLPKEVIEKYRKQLSDYAVLLENATGKKVVQRYLLHVQAGIAREEAV